MKVLFTVCGRAGSKGFKNKNLKVFLGEPLVYYTLSCIDLFKKKYEERFKVDIALNTDDDSLIELAKKTNLDIINIRRDKELGKDDTPKVSVIKNCLEVCEERKNYIYDAIVDVDITSPIRTLKDLENAVFTKINNKKSEVVFSVVEARRNPYFNMIKNDAGVISKVIDSKYVARQQAPKVYDMNASIYVYSREFLKRKEVVSVFDGEIDIIEMMDTAVLDIDSENDFELMKIIADYLYKTNEELSEVKNNISNLI